LKLPDSNVLIYARDRSSPFHRRAQTWMVEALSGDEHVGFTPLALVAFIRISTHPRLPRPMSVPEAFDQVEEWLAQPLTRVLNPGPRHIALFREFLTTAGTGGDLSNDAHLAALGVEHRAMVATFDSDFFRFGIDFEYLNAPQ
jgi:uncharacterized protein